MSEPARNPLLLTRKQARELIGIDPYAVCPPLRFGARVYWHQPTLTEALSSMAAKAVANDTPPDDETPPPRANDTIEDELARARKRITKGAAPARK